MIFLKYNYISVIIYRFLKFIKQIFSNVEALNEFKIFEIMTE